MFGVCVVKSRWIMTQTTAEAGFCYRTCTNLTQPFHYSSFSNKLVLHFCVTSVLHWYQIRFIAFHAEKLGKPVHEPWSFLARGLWPWCQITVLTLAMIKQSNLHIDHRCLQMWNRGGVTLLHLCFSLWSSSLCKAQSMLCTNQTARDL